MFPNSKIVKKNSLAALKGNWAAAVAAIMIPVFFSLIVFYAGYLASELFLSGAVSVVIGILQIAALSLIGAPLLLGTLKFFWHLSDSGEININHVFIYFSGKRMYTRAFHVTLLLAVRVFVIGALMFVPAFIIDFVSAGGLDSLFTTTPLWFTNLWIFAAFLRTLGFIVTALLVFKYYLTPFIFVINDEVEPLEAMHLSRNAARFSSWNYVGLICTMLGWALLTVFALPAFFTLPYMIMTYVIHSNFAVYYYNERIKEQRDYTADYNY